MNKHKSKDVKCVLVGDVFVGKTSMLTTFTEKSFQPNFMPIFLDTIVAKVNIGPIVHTLNLFDTMGQDEYDRLRPLVYPGTDVFLLCFAIDDLDSFLNIKSKWILEIRRHRPSSPIILVATKTDLREDKVTIQKLAAKKQRPISSEQGNKLAQELRAVRYVECSSLQNNLKQVFDEAAIIGSEFKRHRAKQNCHIS